jgi:Na+-transporting NADH:ubiquinone oxidoreductase subunit NqrF
MNALKKCRVRVSGICEIRTIPGLLFLEVLNAQGIDLHNDCGGQGKCGKCRIIFDSPPPEPLEGDRRHLTNDEIARGIRLACFHQITDECDIRVPEVEQPDLLDDL